jgi:predicted porin
MTGGADGSDSRYGLRGVEDLGGGLKANFTFEAGFKPDTGSLDNTANQTFQRSAWVGMSGGMGEVRLGRQYTLGFFGSIANMPSTYVDAQLAAGLGFNGAGSRNSDQLQYWSPKLGGLQVRLSNQQKGDNAAAANEIGLNYTNGPLAVNYTNYKASGVAGTKSALNVAYTTGATTIAAGMVDNTTSGKGNFVLVTTKMGAVSPFVGIAKNTTTGANANQIGAFYELSKRSRLYALRGSGNGAITDKTSIGIDHNF